MSESTVNLDDSKGYLQLDPQGMRNHLRSLPMQCEDAWQLAMRLDLPDGYSSPDRVVIAGMGGSAIAGDLARGLIAGESPAPLALHRGYGLPAYVDKNTLVIASSYSGNTEETLSAFLEALQRKAKAMVITSGGKLWEIAKERGVPCFRFEFNAPPRASLGYLLFSLMAVLQRTRLMRDREPEVRETVESLRKLCGDYGEGSPLRSNKAKQLAYTLVGHIPVVYGAGFLAEVAHRWKTQFNENSKAWSFHEELPELNHNAVVGYTFPSEMVRGPFVLLLRSPLLHPRVLVRYEITTEILDRSATEYLVLDPEGEGALSQMMGYVLLGDYASYYLALLNGIDPTPVKIIDYLKDRLRSVS